MKHLLLSFGIGVLTIASLWGIAMFAATHQDGVIGGIGYVIAGIIDLPLIYLYGPDPQQMPGLFVSLAVYLSEALVVGLLVYPLYFARK